MYAATVHLSRIELKILFDHSKKLLEQQSKHAHEEEKLGIARGTTLFGNASRSVK